MQHGCERRYHAVFKKAKSVIIHWTKREDFPSGLGIENDIRINCRSEVYQFLRHSDIQISHSAEDEFSDPGAAIPWPVRCKTFQQSQLGQPIACERHTSVVMWLFQCLPFRAMVIRTSKSKYGFIQRPDPCPGAFDPVLGLVRMICSMCIGFPALHTCRHGTRSACLSFFARCVWLWEEKWEQKLCVLDLKTGSIRKLELPRQRTV